MSIGVCYFPEHWPRERWAEDVEQMAEAGIDYVRMAEFSWSRLEPDPDTFDVEWLETVVDHIGDRGMNAVLCTPTAAPPKWLVDRHPGIRQEEPDGTVKGFGSRRHYCYNSPAYREETERIVDELADRFADRPAVVGWQTDNEFGCHGTLWCYCDDCAEAFRDWLRDRYDSIDHLNQSWGTTFWSQRYRSFEEVDPPRPTPADHHPSHLLDYQRFTNDGVVDYNRLQADRLREANDDWFVTHNFMCSHTDLDPFAFAGDLDFASWDVYPTGAPQTVPGYEPTEDELRLGDPDQLGLNHDLYRCAAPEAFWVMEQQPGDINWPSYSPQPAEGAMRLWAHHAVAHGADVVSYFRWRRCLEGQEQYHAGLLKQDGSPDRGFHDAERAAADLQPLEIGDVDAQVALLVDHESLWALGNQPMAPDFDPWAHVGTYYEALRGRGATVDIVSPKGGLDTLDGYDALVAPALYLVDDELAAALDRYVEGGGSLLTTMRTGEKDRSDKLRSQLAPGPLAATTGLTVDQHETVNDRFDRRVTYRGETYDYRTWAEWLDVADAAVDGEHVAGVGVDRPAITLREHGSGSCAYVGVWPSAPLADALVVDLLNRAGVDCLDERLADGVRLVERGELTWAFNFGNQSVELDVDAEVLVGDRTLGAYDFAVVDGAVAGVAVDAAGVGTRTE